MTLKIICISEPDISYTRNKELVIQETYLGKYVEEKIGNFGILMAYTVYDMNENYLGQYYAKDFKTIEEYRNDKLDLLLNS